MIILTGASGGIGRALMPLMDCVGIFNDTPIKGYKADLTSLDSIKHLVSELKPSHITVIHLAALKIDELTAFCNENNWDKVFNVNAKGNFLLTKELLKIMMSEKWGRIIHIISSGMGDVGTLTYSASKYALIGMSEVLSREYAMYGITSNVLQLGYFDAGMYKTLSEAKQEELLNQIPSKKLGNVSNIVNAIDFIIKSDYVNGATITIDGGI